jgi:hypothetical protein
MNNLLGDLDDKIGREDIFKMTVENESLHKISSDNGVREVNFTTSKNLTINSTMFLHHNIHRSPDGKTHNQFGHALTDRQWHSSVLDV